MCGNYYLQASTELQRAESGTDDFIKINDRGRLVADVMAGTVPWP